MTQSEKDNYLQRFSSFQQRREKIFTPKFNRELYKQYLQFTSSINKGVEMALLSIDSVGISELIKKLYIDAATVYGNYIRLDLKQQKARMPIGFSEEMRLQVLEYFGIDILNTSEGITQTTRDLIRKVFTEGYELGLSINDIVKKLENTELSKVRARMIARTETVTSANKGAMFIAKKTGLKLNKEWLSAKDKRTRRHHLGTNGQIVPFEEYFTVGDEKMGQPGDRGGTGGRLATDPKEVVNCRCTVLFIPIRDANGRLVTV